MLVSGIKSRPVYPGLQLDIHAKQNIFVVDRPGLAAVIDLLTANDRSFLERSTILLVGDQDGEAEAATLAPANIWVFPTHETAMNRLHVALGGARMGTRLYAAGAEPLIGAVVRLGEQHGIQHNSIRTEHRGSAKRRVQCVHCKGMTDDVTTNPVTCAHCGLSLLVRDHYSRRIGAFMGVRIDAEAPGDIPPSVGEFK